VKRYAVIVAGGKGLRMGGDVPKQFLPIGGKPVLMRTVDAFVKAVPGVSVVLVLPVSQHDYWRGLCVRYRCCQDVAVADGGETRFHSVRNGLSLIPEEEESVVAVHDGVRPFVSAEVIVRCYEEAERCGAAVPVIPVVETVRHLRQGGSVTVPRDEYCLVQTPQTFNTSLLRKAYRQDYRPAFTDDASVVEALGTEVSLVEGNRENLKLTTPSDLAYAEFLVCGANNLKPLCTIR